MRNAYLCSFSGAAAQLPRQHRTPDNILAALERQERVSTFDMSELAWLRTGIRSLQDSGFIRACDEPYPWCRYEITPAGHQRLRQINTPTTELPTWPTKPFNCR